MNHWRRRTAELLEAHRPDDRLGRFIDIFLIVLILANVAAIMLVSVPEIEYRFYGFFIAFELFSIVVFTVEYLARLWSVVEQPLDNDIAPRRTRWQWARSPLGLIDLLAILPFYLFLFLPASSESMLLLRLFRALRLLRIFKLARYSQALNILLAVIRKELPVLLVAASILFTVLVVSSWGIYLAERLAQPELFGSIPQALWWSLITLTTVGYGDVVPVTGAGKIIAGIVALVGIGMLALPAAILASGFNRELRGRSRAYQRAVDLALADGRLSSHESEQLEILRDELGISAQEAVEALLQARHEADPERPCPHCGRLANEAAAKADR